MTRVPFDRLGTLLGDEVTTRDANGNLVQISRPTLVVYRCDDCGSLVNDTDIHAEWHGGQIGREE